MGRGGEVFQTWWEPGEYYEILKEQIKNKYMHVYTKVSQVVLPR